LLSAESEQLAFCHDEIGHTVEASGNVETTA